MNTTLTNAPTAPVMDKNMPIPMPDTDCWIARLVLFIEEDIRLEQSEKEATHHPVKRDLSQPLPYEVIK